MSYLVNMENIRKSFGEVVALDGVNFTVGYNEVVGLIGDNGAGKSTLIKVLVGVHRPDEGKIFIRGEEIRQLSVRKARELKIEVVYQERALGEQQSIWRNIFMGREITRLGFLRIEEEREQAEKVMREIGFRALGLTPDSIVKTLSGGEKQGVTIGRALHFEVDLIILDEPTIALSISEVAKVLDYVAEIKRKGKSAIFITHNIYHVHPVADRFVILDRGRTVAEFKKQDVSLEELMGKLSLIARTGKLS
jgi:simple sugar transport system ATP-binding protein